ncbi:hypothetical protein LZ906_009015 [Paraclostridium ghonii]|uniref:hypothetical protein n=1 Tax=Paraclostridium ghonii TaxID=29358 RepID=UPI00202CF1AE|nr:hypothetical protein [Paeniclostridium ghonii]MCM0166408.1 hypothetical protein [Paeniclostridium ghonii]
MKSYMFPCNLEKYDILGSFLKNGFVDYSTNLKVDIGDTVYLYNGAPYSAIFLKCQVRLVLERENTIDDNEFSKSEVREKSKYVRLIPVKNYLSKIDLVSSKELSKNGVKGYSFQIKLEDETVRYIENI